MHLWANQVVLTTPSLEVIINLEYQALLKGRY